MDPYERNPRYLDFDAKGNKYRLFIFDTMESGTEYRLWKLMTNGHRQEDEDDAKLLERLKHIVERSANI